MTALTSGFRPGRRGPGRTPHVKEAQRRSALQPGLDPGMELQELNDARGTDTAAFFPKVRALESRPDVALTIDEGSESGNAKSLQIRGQAMLETVDGVPDEYLESAAISPDAEHRAEFDKQVRLVHDQMVRISIEPGWARFYAFGAGRLPGFLTKVVSGRGGRGTWESAVSERRQFRA
jgi:hypothetical protein